MDKNQIEKQFSLHSRSYAAESRVQADMAAALLRLLPSAYSAQNILEFGAGSGNLSRLLAQRWPTAALQLLDISESMLALNRELLEAEQLDAGSYKYIVGDVETVYPVTCGGEHQAFDLVCSNATWQWLQWPEALLQRIYDSLRPGGVFLLGSFGPRTLFELYASYERAQGCALEQRVRYQSAEALQRQVAAAGFDVECSDLTFEVAHASPRELLRSLKRMGVTSCSGQGTQFTPRSYRLFDADYREHYALPHGGVGATWQAVFACATKPAVH